jgi:hypothetical protein
VYGNRDLDLSRVQTLQMISEQTNIGDLVYIPSQALLTEQAGADAYKKFIRTDKPVNVLCVGKRNIEIKVFYNGSSWWVNKKLVYPIKEDNGS